MYRIRKKERNDRLFLSRYPYMDIKTYNDIRATRHDATSMILLQNSLSYSSRISALEAGMH